MKLVVDSNILISSLINPNSNIATLILSNSNYELFAPHFLFSELIDKTDKILKITGYTNKELHELLQIFSRRIKLVDEELIPKEIWQAAFKMTESIDEHDTPFVAMAIYLDAYLWTGDLKLSKGLKKKGFDLVKLTSELKVNK